ncbi:glycosyltransferase family 2 protein [Methylobacterium sp. Leaf465]|uniref:glycosyltransferase family 2 protein n=1 Tax=Methylobacterium sp. Leaf465 TaxID=1736385 RepID=UPI000AFA1F42|nr:glycosyltransferase family 2 protein [Methylobacterium sp. Leaf465]
MPEEPSNKTKMSIGIVLFNQDRDGFVDTIKSIARSIENLDVGVSLDIEVKYKWNSSVLFDADEVCREYGISSCSVGGNFNIGFGSAHNAMMQKSFAAMSDYYLCMNPDGFLHPDAIKNLIKFSADLGHPALIEAIQFPIEHPKPYDPFTGETQWCSGACLLISKEIYRSIGGYDDNIFMYCEDIDLSWRVRMEGFKCFTCSSALFFHDVSEIKSSLIRRLMLESARYLAAKWSAPEFQAEMERQLIESRFYPNKDYLPPIKKPKEIFQSSEIQEWRQLLSFSLPRW